MRKILLVARREFIATISTKAFIIGLLILPIMFGVMALLIPRVMNPRNFKTQGEVVVIDPSGAAIADIRTAFSPQRMIERREAQAQQLLNQAPAAVQQLATAGQGQTSIAAAMGAPDLRLIERPADSDLQKEKPWLLDQSGTKHLAIIVIHDDAVRARDGRAYGSYDAYVPATVDDRAMGEIHNALQEAILNARTRTLGVDRAQAEALVRVARGRSTTVTKDSEHNTVRGINAFLPIVFVMLMFMGTMTASQALLTSTVEEKSNRVMEVLLSAISPFELLAGKLLGQMGAGLIALGLYVGLGLALLLSFAMFGLLNPWLILYLMIFFLVSYLTYGSLMVSIGAVVNDMREAQSLMMPVMLMLTFPFFVWMPISLNPNSAFSTAVSFLPPFSSFAMLIRMTSTAPPPWWQVWLSIAAGAVGVVAAIWFASKVFKVGLLMYGKPPNIATLMRWARQA